MSVPKTWVAEVPMLAMMRNCSPSVSCEMVSEPTTSRTAKTTRL